MVPRNTEIALEGVEMVYPTEAGTVTALTGVSFDIRKGEFISLLGPSGCGKTTLLRIIAGLIQNTGGTVAVAGMTPTQARESGEMGMVFQSAVLYDWRTVIKNVMLPMEIKGVYREEQRQRAEEMLELVGLSKFKNSYPYELSGGMQQRAMIAMAMSCNPEILIADEPTTALDVTVQAQVLEQLNKLRRDHNMALILITHNLGVVARYADSVKIMYGGKIVESGTPFDIFENPHHPYTLGLIRAVPRLDLPRSHGLHTIEGEPPDMSKIGPNCCAFHLRCKYADERCASCRPELEEIGEGHYCACFHRDQLDAEREEVLHV